jgi:Mg-chelatase subunit ChlD
MPDTEKIIDKIRKLSALAESEAAMGNEGAAENIAAKAQELLIKYKLTHKDIKLVQETEPDYIPPIMGKSLVINPFLRVNARVKTRMPWLEKLAEIVANAYFCKSQWENGDIWFYGLDMDREIAVFMFGKIVERAKRVHDQEFDKSKQIVGMKRIAFGKKTNGNSEDIPKVWLGDETFSESFHKGFRAAIHKSFTENLDYDSDAYKESMENIEEFMRKNPPNFDWQYRHERSWENVHTIGDDNWDFALKLGIKYGSRVAKNVSSPAESTKQDLIQSEKRDSISGEAIMVLDDSGSMGGERIMQLHEGAREFASDAIAKGFIVGAVKFGNEPKLIIAPQKEVNSKFINAINNLNANSGGTEMVKALRLAQAHFTSPRVKRTIMLVTDGYPTDDGGEDAVIQVALELKRSGIELLAVGCGNANEEFLKRLATKPSFGELVSDNDLGKGMKRMAGLLTA